MRYKIKERNSNILWEPILKDLSMIHKTIKVSKKVNQALHFRTRCKQLLISKWTLITLQMGCSWARMYLLMGHSGPICIRKISDLSAFFFVYSGNTYPTCISITMGWSINGNMKRHCKTSWPNLTVFGEIENWATMWGHKTSLPLEPWILWEYIAKHSFNVLCIEGLANLHANTRHETATGPVDELASSYVHPSFLNCCHCWLF
jgi:hypothetical protein